MNRPDPIDGALLWVLLALVLCGVLNATCERFAQPAEELRGE